VVADASVVLSTPQSIGRHHVNRIRRSIHTACQDALSIDEAAELLRANVAVVEEATRLGQIPTVEHHGSVFIDGPALMARFRQPVLQEINDAS
jgi:hypothetical protein